MKVYTDAEFHAMPPETQEMLRRNGWGASAPSEPAGPAKVVAAVSTGSVAGEKLTKRQLINVAAWLNSSRQLEKMTPRELIDECLKSDAADYDIVIELMNRVLPGWATDDMEDQPQNSKISQPEKNYEDT